MRERTRKLVTGVALVIAFTLLVLQPFLLPINAQTSTTLPSSSNTSVVESKDWVIKPKLANGLVILDNAIKLAVNITINNTQAIATPAPFDQFINITEQELGNALGASTASGIWSQANSYHFLNLLFMNSSGKPLYAWVMNYTSSWVAVWVKLPKGISAKSVINITLEFTNSIQYPYTGIYSAVYKGYDNGNYTFAQYGYFNDTVPSGWKTGVNSGSFSPTPTTSGLEMANDAQNEGTYAYASIPNLNSNYTVIVSWWYNSGADALTQELYGNVSKLSDVSSIGSTAGGVTPYAANGTVAQNEFGASAAYVKNATTSKSTSFDGSGTYYVTTYFAIQGNTQYYGYTNHALPFQITLPSSFVSFNLATDRSEPTVFIGAGTGSSGYGYIYLDTVIVIPTPPNNVMPSVAAVKPSGNTSGMAGQYIAWGYKPAGNTLNISIQIKNYTTGIHGFPGLVIYSANMGNYTNDNSTSGFSAILVSFAGAVTYHPSDASTYTFINTSAFPEPKPPFNMTVTLAKDPFGDTSVFKVYLNKTVYILNVSLPLPWSQIGYIGLRADPDNNFTSTDPTVTAYNTTIGATATVTTTTTSTTTTTTTSTTTTTTTSTTTIANTTITSTTTSTVTATKVVTTTTTSTITTAVTTVYLTTTYVITSTVTVKSAMPSGLSLSSIYILVAVVTILVAIPAGIMASRSTAQDSGRRYVQKA
jgi:hypothetical protein